MAATTSPQDKFAFLFSGVKDTDPCNDLEMIYNTLVNYYGFKSDNIKVVYGGNDLTNASFAPAGTSSVSNVAEFTASYDAFITTAPANNGGHSIASVPALGGHNTVLVFLTGNVTSAPELIINEDPSTPVTISDSQLYGMLDTVPANQINAEMHFVINTDNALDIIDSIYGSMIVLRSTFTASCGNGETAPSDFVAQWTNALKLKEKDMGGGLFETADTFNSGALDDPDNLVSLREASLYATGNTDLYMYRNFMDAGEDINCFLGKPKMYINDGPPEARWRSEDIWLTHPDPPYNTDAYKDLYVCDDPLQPTVNNNFVNIRARNLGTHPVRLYYVGALLTPTGVTPDGEKALKEIDIFGIDGAGYKPLAPGTAASTDNTDPMAEYQETHIAVINDMFFDDAGHRCIRAKLKDVAVTDTDMNSLSVYTMDDEAQRNINPIEICGEKSGDTGGTGAGGEEKEDDVKEKSISRYMIKNTFDTRKKFRIIFPRNYHKAEEYFDFRWDWGKAIRPVSGFGEERVLDDVRYVDFMLLPGETRILNLALSAKTDKKITKPLELDFDILVEGDWDFTRIAGHGLHNFSRHASVGGFTLSIKTGSAELTGKLDIGDLARDAVLHIRTPENLQKQDFTFEKDGSFRITGLNPGTYFLSVITKKGKSKEYLVRLKDTERHHLKLALRGVRLVENKPLQEKK
ncbi:MAG TPA: hypothetical protein VMW76_05160 [Bacteroidales bacterium]|nr:hypothetical protein [Bacteroidales bacterium]